MSEFRLFFVSTLLIVFCLAGVANASLTGDEIYAAETNPDLTMPITTATIGSGVEFTWADIDFDFGDASLTITHNHDGGHGWGQYSGILKFTGFDATITDVTRVSNDGFYSGNFPYITWDSDFIQFDMSNLGADPYAQMIVSINTSAVPIPGAFLLFGSGLFGLVGFMRKIKE